MADLGLRKVNKEAGPSGSGTGVIKKCADM